MRHPLSRQRWQRRLAASFVGLFAWSATLAVPAQALAHPSRSLPPGVRSLSLAEMQRIVGSQGTSHFTSVSPEAGSAYPWEASVAGVNTGNGNKLTQVPLVGWTARGGMPVSFSLAHNSQSAHNSELGQKWTHSFDLFLVPSDPSADFVTVAVHWGDDLAYVFSQNVDGSYSAPRGIHDILVKNADGTFTLTKKDQTKYHYTVAGYCDTITDRNANQIGISYTPGNYVSTVTDPSGRTLTLGYDASNRISTITDLLSHVWSLAYDANNNLSSIGYPALGASTYYSESFGYNTAHDITAFTDKRGHTSAFTYNASDNSLATGTCQ